MPYSTEIETMIEHSLEQGISLTKKKMFGGICYLYCGNMCFGIYKDFLIVRLGDADQAEQLIDGRQVLAFDITGRKMKGWVMVEKKWLQQPEKLNDWLASALKFARTLPPK